MAKFRRRKKKKEKVRIIPIKLCTPGRLRRANNATLAATAAHLGQVRRTTKDLQVHHATGVVITYIRQIMEERDGPERSSRPATT